MNRRQRRSQSERPYSNKKGLQLIVTRFGNSFTKYKRVFQQIGNKRIVHYVEA